MFFSGFSSSTSPPLFLFSRCQERLATVNWGEQEEDDEEKDVTIWETVVRIRKPKSAEEETELKLPGRKCNNSSIISFQSERFFGLSIYFMAKSDINATSCVNFR